MSKESKDGLATGKQPGVPNDVADPHPASEPEGDKSAHPGGGKPPKAPDIGPNSYAHDGSAPPRPDNRGAGPK